MASFDVVNYSLRPSKSIKRQLVFDPSEKYVTLMSKNMWLSFELYFALVKNKSF